MHTTCPLFIALPVGGLHLHVDSGRFTQTPKEGRECEVRNLLCLEDEHQFRFDWPAYSRFVSVMSPFPKP